MLEAELVYERPQAHSLHFERLESTNLTPIAYNLNLLVRSVAFEHDFKRF